MITAMVTMAKSRTRPLLRSSPRKRSPHKVKHRPASRVRTDGRSESAALYRLMAWLSPAYPVGAFSYSSGIEWAVEAGDIRDADTLKAWLAAILSEGGGFADAVFFVHAHRASADDDTTALRAVAELAAAFVPSKERFLETTAQGRAFLEATRAAWPCEAIGRLDAAWDGPVALPVAVGVACAGHGIACKAALPAFLHALTANWISAGVRLIPLGQTDGQRVLAALENERCRRRGARVEHAACRHRQCRVPRRHCQHAARDPIHAPVQELDADEQKQFAWPLARRGRRPGRLRQDRADGRACKRLRDRYEIAAITNDIYTKWDAEYLVRSGALVADRIAGVETGGCPHTAIREDASANLAAIADMRQKFPALDLVLIESGGDNLAATFSPELADLTIYVIDVAAGDKIPSKGGPGITRSDLLVINKVDLAPHVGASLETMEREVEKDARRAAVRVHQSARRQGRRGDRKLHRGEGRVGRDVIAHHTEKDGDAVVRALCRSPQEHAFRRFRGERCSRPMPPPRFSRRGFALAFENESDGSVSHVEFVALYPKTGKRFSVEVKARERAAASAAQDVG